jgi:uncharacterized membrane protein
MTTVWQPKGVWVVKGDDMDMERTWWFQLIVIALALVTTLMLFRFDGHWPYGSRSMAGGVIFVLCMLALQRLYAGLLAVGAIWLKPQGSGPTQL